MKKALAFLLVFSLFAMVYPAAQTEEKEPEIFAGGDWIYIIREDGMAEVIRYNGEGTELSVPEELDGRKVTGIGEDTFVHCASMTSVTIPDTVASIEANPFAVCAKLTDIRVSPDHPYLAVTDGVLFSKPDERLVCCSPALGKPAYTIPQGTRMIGCYAFYNNSSLASVTIPDSVTSIGESAFVGCSSLTSITIPDGVTDIGDVAFYDCSSLTSVTIPDSLTNIGTNPFLGCNQLTDIRVSPDHPYLAVTDGVLFSKQDKRLVCYPRSLTTSEYTIPQGTELIGFGAFYGCSSLTSVTIPDGVTSVGSSAFAFCSTLTSVTIPDSVTSIGEWAFSGCSALTVTVGRNSYAEQYFEENGIRYTYKDANE